MQKDADERQERKDANEKEKVTTNWQQFSLTDTHIFVASFKWIRISDGANSSY